MQGIPERQVTYTNLNNVMSTLVTELVSEGVVTRTQGKNIPNMQF